MSYRRLQVLLEREGIHANHKREAGLAVRRRRRRHGVMVEREPLTVPAAPNEVWSIDFVMGALSSGRRLKCLTIVDDFTKEAVDIVVDHGSLTSAAVGHLNACCWEKPGGVHNTLPTKSSHSFDLRTLYPACRIFVCAIACPRL